MASTGIGEQGNYALRECRGIRQRLAGVLNSQLRQLDQQRWPQTLRPAFEHERELLLTAMEALLVAPWERPLTADELATLEILEEANG